LPGRAQSTLRPASGTLLAPQTTSVAPAPPSTVTTVSFGELGCGRRASTSATTTPSKSPPSSTIDSTSNPAWVSRPASACTWAGGWPTWASPAQETFIVAPRARSAGLAPGRLAALASRVASAAPARGGTAGYAHSRSSELPQEADVVLVEEVDRVHAVAQ